MPSSFNNLLNDLDLFLDADVPAPKQGNLNVVGIVRDSGNNRYCLRQVRAGGRENENKYIMALYTCMGLHDFGGHIHYRSIPEQAEATDTYLRHDIHVPRILHRGDDWMLMEYVQGTPFSIVLPTCTLHDMRQPIACVLTNLMRIHHQGLQVWDRWGGNELIHKNGKTDDVTLIDFDLEVHWPESVPNNIKNSFDLAIALYGCLQFSSHVERAKHLVQYTLLKNPHLAEDYHLPVLSQFLVGQGEFYKGYYCHSGRDESIRSRYENINKALLEIVAHIAVPAVGIFVPSPVPETRYRFLQTQSFVKCTKG